MSTPVVLLDTNIWVKEQLLRSGLGAAALYAVRASRFRIVLTDTQRDEIESRVLAFGFKIASRVQNDLSTLQAITGSKPAVVLPQQPELLHAITERFNELASILVPYTVSHELIRQALRRVNDHRAPSGEKEQFRDALLWEAALAMTRTRDIHFVSDDGDFAAAGKLRPELTEDVNDTPCRLSFYASLRELLRKLAPNIPSISVPAVTQKILAELGRHLAELRDGPVFNLGQVAEASAEAYVTERPNALAVSFELSLHASRRDEPEIPGRIIIRGECMYHAVVGAVFDVRPQHITFRTAADESNLVTFGYAEGLGTSSRSVPYRVRRAVASLASESSEA